LRCEKLYIVIILSILLLIALFGLVKSFATPFRVQQREIVQTVEYQGIGNFDKRGYCRPRLFLQQPASAYGSDQSPDSPEIIESFEMGLSLSSCQGPASETLKIDSILESAGVWKKTSQSDA